MMDAGFKIENAKGGIDICCSFSNCKRKIVEGELCFNLFRRGEWRHIECFEIYKKCYYKMDKTDFLRYDVKDESRECILSSQEGIDSIAEKLGSKCKSFYAMCSELFVEGNWKQHANNAQEQEVEKKCSRITKNVADLTDIELAEKLAIFIHNFDAFPKIYCEEIRYDLEDMHFWEWFEEIQLQRGIGKKKQMLLALFKDQIVRCIAQEAWWKIVFFTGGSYLHDLFDHYSWEELDSLDEGDEDSDVDMETGSFDGSAESSADESIEDLDNRNIESSEDESTESSEDESTESSDDESTENLGREIRALVRCIPEALSCYDETCIYENLYMLPIHSAILMIDQGLVSNHSSSSLFFLLLEEGLKHDIPIAPPTKEYSSIGERFEDARGGLFSRFDQSDEWSTILDRLIGCYKAESSTLDDLKRLKQMDFINKKDIIDYSLVTRAAETRNFSILSWIASWCPEALKGKVSWLHENQLFMHVCARDSFETRRYYNFQDEFPFKKVLEISFQYFPDELGLLFLEDGHGKTTISHFYEYMRNDSCFYGRGDYIIFGKNTIKNFVWKKIIKSIIKKADPAKVATINTSIGMFPFMLAAQEKHGTLDLIYYLMRKDPGVWSSIS